MCPWNEEFAISLSICGHIQSPLEIAKDASKLPLQIRRRCRTHFTKVILRLRNQNQCKYVTIFRIKIMHIFYLFNPIRIYCTYIFDTIHKKRNVNIRIWEFCRVCAFHSKFYYCLVKKFLRFKKYLFLFLFSGAKPSTNWVVFYSLTLSVCHSGE